MTKLGLLMIGYAGIAATPGGFSDSLLRVSIRRKLPKLRPPQAPAVSAPMPLVSFTSFALPTRSYACSHWGAPRGTCPSSCARATPMRENRTGFLGQRRGRRSMRLSTRRAEIASTIMQIRCLMAGRLFTRAVTSSVPTALPPTRFGGHRERRASRRSCRGSVTATPGSASTSRTETRSPGPRYSCGAATVPRHRRGSSAWSSYPLSRALTFQASVSSSSRASSYCAHWHRRTWQPRSSGPGVPRHRA